MEYSSEMVVKLVKHNVSDEDVVDAARVSTRGDGVLADGLKPTDEASPDVLRNQGLINFLMRDRHGSPFEHGSMTFFISAPIFVFREFHRHRAGWSYNEESARYKELSPKFYVPDGHRKLVQTGKPGAYRMEYGSMDQFNVVEAEMEAIYDATYDTYQHLIHAGIAREVARSVLPVGIYSSMYATTNPRAMMNFLSLRVTSPHTTVPTFPQREIEMVGELMESEFATLMPLTYDAFNKNGRIAP